VTELRIDAVTRRYAEALFGLALRQGALDDVQRDVQRLGAELAAPSVEAYLFDTRVTLADRRAKLDPVVAGMHALTRNFVSLVFDKRREEVLRHLGAAFHERRLVHDRAAEGVVESPAPLRGEDVDRLAAVLSRVLDKRVHLENEVVPDLLAGVRVTADNRMIDYSARGRLDELRRKLLGAALPTAGA
jgi:F-type H+-transporting ATPase subunit delta